ncbi:DUF3426 domain-containing protein [Rugamonas brunnea]
MAALDTHAATALRPAPGDSGAPLELDTLELDTLELDRLELDTAETADAGDAGAPDDHAGDGYAFAHEDASAKISAEPLPAPSILTAPAIQADTGYVPPATAYAPSGAPFALPPSAAAYAGGIDATPTLPPTPAPAEDKLELDLNVDLEPATEVLDWDAPANAASVDAIPASAPEPESTAAPEAEHDLAPPAAEPEHFSPFTLDEAFQLEPEDMADAGSALEIDTAGEPAPNALADGRREPTWGEPATPPAAAEPAASPAALSEADDEDEVLVDLSPAARAHTTAPLPVKASRDDDEPTLTARQPDAGMNADTNADTVAEQEEPGFVKRHHRRQRLGKLATIAMSAGSVLLVGTLVGQAATTFRNPLAASVPQLKPALQSLCAALGCKVELPAQIDYVTIEQGELQTLSESTFSFTTLLRNQSTTAQAWPDIELRLDDANDKAVLRRVFTPRDYLGPDADPGKGFAPHSEQSVKLYFELKQLKASGYHIAVFYP